MYDPEENESVYVTHGFGCKGRTRISRNTALSRVRVVCSKNLLQHCYLVHLWSFFTRWESLRAESISVRPACLWRRNSAQSPCFTTSFPTSAWPPEIWLPQITIIISLGFPGSSDGKEFAWNAGDRVRSLLQKDLLEKEMAAHSSIPAWRTLWTEEPGKLQSIGSQRVRHEWVTNTN